MGPDYSRYSLSELMDAAAHVDRERYPERYARIQREIASRDQATDASSTLPIGSDPPPSSVPSNGLELYASPFVKGAVIVAAIVLGAIGALYGFLYWDATRPRTSALDYLGSAVPPILESWEPEKLIAEMPPSVDPESERVRLFVCTLERLGELRSLGEFDGKVSVSLTTGSGYLPVGQFEAKATFVEGDAVIHVTLQRADSRWYITTFSVNSDKLFQEPG